MRESLSRWVREADALAHIEHLRTSQISIELERVRSRWDDLFISLVGGLFDAIRSDEVPSGEWERLGNAFLQFAVAPGAQLSEQVGVSPGTASLYSATAFYLGGYPASAYLAMNIGPDAVEDELAAACVDLLHHRAPESSVVASALEALREGREQGFRGVVDIAVEQVEDALAEGPRPWVLSTLLAELLERLAQTNLRTVLPDGWTDFWTPLVESFLDRRPPSWGFFPSQIQAVEAGLVDSAATFSLQMPTGSGKTALSEVLLYSHLSRRPGECAVLLVPYRSLASELKKTLVPRLAAMGLPTVSVYGGSVPERRELVGLEDVRAVVATPEALSGLLSADPDFLNRISLVICDEGHLLDTPARGIGLELLLARLRERGKKGIRFVFLSAIIPNIDEVNSWLGGSTDSVVRSTYRPALAEFAVLRSTGSGVKTRVALEMHPERPAERGYTLTDFLQRQDFRWRNPETDRLNTWSFDSYKAQAVAAGRKVLPMGAVAVFSANKRGDQGVVGLVEELMAQDQAGLNLLRPLDFANQEAVAQAQEYFAREYGASWIGARAMAAGVVIHHGDVPQETREVMEDMLRGGDVRLAFCTNTLAEGVNLPIRTLVLYSVRRRGYDGRATDLLQRDIKNLVGRAGRAGSSTRGLVICANEGQWDLIKSVALDEELETVEGGLRRLVERLRNQLALEGGSVSNALLEGRTDLLSLIDGVDSLLLDLAAEELGEDALRQHARDLADGTFSSTRSDELSQATLREVFLVRLSRILELREEGKLPWVRESGARPRLVGTVEEDLIPAYEGWSTLADPLDEGFTRVLVDWALRDREFRESLDQVYPDAEGGGTDGASGSFHRFLRAWLRGEPFQRMAAQAELDIDDALRLHAFSVSYLFQTLVEQGLALAARFLDQGGTEGVSDAVRRFPEHLRFGVPDRVSLELMQSGVRHRRAAVELGLQLRTEDVLLATGAALRAQARGVLEADEERWGDRLGQLVMRNTLHDLA